MGRDCKLVQVTCFQMYSRAVGSSFKFAAFCNYYDDIQIDTFCQSTPNAILSYPIAETLHITSQNHSHFLQLSCFNISKFCHEIGLLPLINTKVARVLLAWWGWASHCAVCLYLADILKCTKINVGNMANIGAINVLCLATHLSSFLTESHPALSGMWAMWELWTSYQLNNYIDCCSFDGPTMCDRIEVQWRSNNVFVLDLMTWPCVVELRFNGGPTVCLYLIWWPDHVW